jgi:hypothetical protein
MARRFCQKVVRRGDRGKQPWVQRLSGVCWRTCGGDRNTWAGRLLPGNAGRLCGSSAKKPRGRPTFPEPSRESTTDIERQDLLEQVACAMKEGRLQSTDKPRIEIQLERQREEDRLQTGDKTNANSIQPDRLDVVR